jgi:delta 1-pyrroline-5-carboxylate dehydrogenase
MKWPNWLKGRLTATPGTEVTGFDQAAVIRRVARHMHDTAERNSERMRRERAKWQYETRETVTCLVEAVDGGFKATTIADVGGSQVVARARTIASLDTEMRYQLAQAYVAWKLTEDYDEARKRAALAELYMDRSFALGSKGTI